MILSKAPMRIGLFGGGSDIPAHYLQWGGSTISTAIDKYVYVSVYHTPQNHIKVSYSKQECVTNVDDLENEIIKNTLKFFDIDSNIEINTFADIPTIGTGLAGSSAFTCALIVALFEYCNSPCYDPYTIAEIACHIELKLCGWKIGKQDQYASAFGGMNYIQYSNSEKINVSKMNPNNIDDLMLLIPTNIQRHSSDILDKIDFNDKSYFLRELSIMADLNYKYSTNINEYGPLLNSSWELKKQMENNISKPEIDSMVERCIECGANGVKLLGAGGGGYMLSLTKNKESIRNEFSDRVCLDVKVAQDGARVIYKD
jgi:D-glycero-alpha-D-manno-heptose-7-phosphate kinase